jgi:hypothetical protein
VTPRHTGTAPPRVGVLGYLAVLERVAVPVGRAQLGAGSVGERLPATLTADAPLVALALSAMADVAIAAGPPGAPPPWTVHATLNHPGTSPSGQACLQLLAERLPQLQLGPDSGIPLEWQVLHADGEVTWYNDPAPALASLRRLPAVDWSELGWQHLYLDAYPWLTPALAAHLPLRVPTVWLNLGVTALEALAAAVANWRPAVEGQLHVQVSTAGRAHLDQAVEWAHIALNAGADFVAITSAQHGLVLANAQGHAAEPALPVQPWADASGAGAAVSAALIAAQLCAPEPTSAGHLSQAALSSLARQAARAGQQQCGVHGALDTHSLGGWLQVLNRAGLLDEAAVHTNARHHSPS